MSFKNIILPLLAKSYLTKKVLQRNKKFEGLHKGESCYIFGSGGSIKYFDLSKFNDKIAISCGLFYLHRDFDKVNIRYYFEGHPFIHYRYWVHPYSNKIKKSIIGILYREKMSRYQNVSNFVNLSDYLGIRGNNIYYLHHFAEPFKSYSDSQLCGKFPPMVSSLGGMLGLALFMGIKDITLVGCDYTLFPQRQGHFFEFGKFPDAFSEEPNNKEYLVDATRYANIRIVTPLESYRGHILPHISYKELTGADPVYKENYEIVLQADLLTLSCSGMAYKPLP